MKRTNSRRWLILVLSMVTAIGIVVLLTNRPRSDELEQGPPSDREDVGLGISLSDVGGVKSPGAAQDPAAHLAAELADAVPSGTPLSESKKTLSELADAGDPIASCRLALELLLCSEPADPDLDLMEGLVGSVPSMRESTQELLIDGIAATQERAESRMTFCGDVESVSVGEIERRARDAVVMGGIRQRVLYALRAPNGSIVRIGPRAGFTFTQEGGNYPTQFYADHAYQFLQEGLGARDILALEGLILIHVPDASARPDALPLWMPNPARFFVLSGVLEQVAPELQIPREFDAIRQKIEAELTPKLRGELEEMIQRETRRWLDSKPSYRLPPMLGVDTSQSLCLGD